MTSPSNPMPEQREGGEQPVEMVDCLIISDYRNARVRVLPVPEGIVHDPEEIKARWLAYGPGPGGQPDTGDTPNG